MTVHTQLSAEIARQLASKLRPRYLALTTERFVLETPTEISIATTSLYPDVGVARAGAGTIGGGGSAVATAPLQLATLISTPVPHVTVEIRDVAARGLVTAIQVLSPTNKRGEGRQEYLAKRGRLLLSTAHLIEIDLLREGQRVPLLEPLPPAPYFVFLSRAENRPILDVWPIQLDQTLPEVAVPLLPDHQDVLLDLQLALTTVYDAVGYDLAVDYSQPPPVPLAPGEAAWANERISAYHVPGEV